MLQEIQLGNIQGLSQNWDWDQITLLYKITHDILKLAHKYALWANLYNVSMEVQQKPEDIDVWSFPDGLWSYLRASRQRSVPAVSASEQQDWQILLTQSRLFCHILWSCALQWEKKRDRARETGCHPHHKATIPVSCCPSFPDPASIIEAHWLGWGREATIVRVSLFVNPQPPTLELTGVAKQQLTE